MNEESVTVEVEEAVEVVSLQASKVYEVEE